jgi:probable addiction module antidote protein
VTKKYELIAGTPQLKRPSNPNRPINSPVTGTPKSGRGHQECARNVENIEPTGQKAGQEGVTMAANSRRGKIKVAPYDSADCLKTEADIKYYLEAAFDEPMDLQLLIHTLGVVARARGMMKLSKETDITRAGLYKALSPDGNPSFETVTRIIGASGMRLSAHAA